MSCFNILVCSKDSATDKDRDDPAWVYLRSLGHRVQACHPSQVDKRRWKPDALLGMGVTLMEETFAAKEQYPNVPLFLYNWDCYEWVWTNPRPGEYDYKRYGELVRLATEVWVPSECTRKRTYQWWPWTKKCEIILSACPWWEWPEDDIKDDGFALCALRDIPDPWCGVFEKCCEEIGMSYKSLKHEASEYDYKYAITHCRFIVDHYYEASTGGLSLMEAYYHGKPALISDSEWNGGIDYMGDRAWYFNYPDLNSFKGMLRSMYNQPPVLDRAACRNWITANYSDKRMADDVVRRIHANLQ